MIPATVCEIAQLGASVLRQTALPVSDIGSADVQQLISDMHTTLASTEGVGLAAPQIGVSKQVVIVASRPSKRYPSAPLMEATVMINPTFQPLSDQKLKDWEGCLSVPGVRGLVPRYQDIQVDYISEQGVAITQRLEGFVARVFQHEYDHLQGKVYLDRVVDNADIIAESEYFNVSSG